MRMDYLEVSAVGGEVVATTKPAVCICTAGFMADIIGMSESSRYRPFGPFRNDVAGFLALLRNRAHACDIKYKEYGGGLAQADDCTGASCPHCATATTNTAAAGWKVLRGDFLSVMILNTACKSDKTPHGMNHRVHLGDGSAYLVWVLISTEVCSLFARPDSHSHSRYALRSFARCVQKVNPLRYLLFLLCMSLFGLRKYDRAVVQIIPVVDVEVAGPSAWNVDGELVQAGTSMRVRVKHRGLPVFGR